MAEDLTHSAGPLGDTAAEPAVTPFSPPGYELIEEIGHGGMGVVYRARDVALDRDVAVGQIERVNERSDVFGLGALLAVILTGKPPYVGENYESVRVQAVRGKLEDCFARLDGCGAEPELTTLCKKCLAFEPADRPADAGAVAAAVAGLRAAADERARRAELDKVRVEGEKAAAEARAVERRKRRRLAVAAAAVLAAAVVGGLSAVLAVQGQANADLAAKNRDLVAEQAKVQAKNAELADEQAKVQARFDMAAKAIALFHTSVSEDMLLTNAEFKELRTKLLKQAAGFYAELENLLAGQTDAKSQKALAAAYFQLGELTDKIDDKKEALAVHRKALALRWELAAEGADVEARLDVARSLEKVGGLLRQTGDYAGALAAHEEQRKLSERLEAEHPTDAVRSSVAGSHHNIAWVFKEKEKLEEALVSYGKALAIQQKLADANPGVAEFQRDLAHTHNAIGNVLSYTEHVVRIAPTGKGEEALVSYGKALAIQQKLADAHPAAAEFQRDLASTHGNIGRVALQQGKLEEALRAMGKALAIYQELAKANKAVTALQKNLANAHNNIGTWLGLGGKPEEALLSFRKALPIYQKLADANPAVLNFQANLVNVHINIFEMLVTMGKLEEATEAQREVIANSQKMADANPTAPYYRDFLAGRYNILGRLLARQKRFAEAFTALDAGLDIRRKLTEADPKNTEYTNHLGYSHAYWGWALVRSGQPSKAAADLRRAVELWAKDKQPDSEDHFERPRALALLAGLGGEAKSGVTAAEAARFADQSVAALRDAINAGWNEPNELTEPDFDVLRGRDDFKKLLAELEARNKAKAAKKEAASRVMMPR